MRIARVALAILTASACHAQLVKDWRVVRSPHFEIVSRYDPAATRQGIAELEWARAALEHHLGVVTPFAERTLVLVTDNPYDYQKLSGSSAAAGHYIGTADRDVIVLRDFIDPRHTLLHEYTHLVTHRGGGVWPLWFNEGTAEYYATLRRTKTGVEAGVPDPARIRLIATGAWVPVAYLVGLTTSAELPSEEFAGKFYAQSWLYTHLLRHSPDYRDRFDEFRKLAGGGADTARALRQIYGKSLNQFDEDARVWIRQKQFAADSLGAVAIEEPKIEVELITDEQAAQYRSQLSR